MGQLQTDLSGLIAAVSLAIGVVTCIVGYLERRDTQRKAHTIAMLTRIYESGPIHESHLYFIDLIAKDCPVDSSDAKVIEQVNPLLEYYDFIGSGVDRGLLDRELILVHRGAAMYGTYKCVAEHIAKRRELLGRPNLYRPFEQFVGSIDNPSDY